MSAGLRAPQRKARALTLLKGSNNPSRDAARDRLAAIENVKETPMKAMPKPPPWMKNRRAIEEWKRLGPILMDKELLSDASLATFHHMCCVHGKMADAWASDRMPSVTMFTMYRGFVADFGLTPLAVTKLKMSAIRALSKNDQEDDDLGSTPENKASGNRFNRNGQAPDENQAA